MNTPPSNQAQHLVALTLAPVQSFIEAARRTRDLWAGSVLLSSLSLDLAKHLQGQSAELLLPSPAALKSAAAAAAAAAVSNKIFALLPSAGIETLLAGLDEFLIGKLQQRADALLAELKQMHLDSAIDLQRFNSQWREAFNLYWAACPLDEQTNYAQCYRDVLALLDARKASRLFGPVPARQPSHSQAQDGRRRGPPVSAPPLSSLGGLNESVLLTNAATDKLRRRFQVNSTEALDALSLYKRVAASSQGFPSVARVALQPWVQALDEEQVIHLKTAVAALTHPDIALARRYQVPAAFVLKDGPYPAAADQPRKEAKNPLTRLNFDCEFLLPQRREEWARAWPAHAEALLHVATALHGLPELPKEGPYVCTLAADGDLMGPWLSADQVSPQVHIRISEALAQFAANVPAWAAQHGGASIYAGGDDVLAVCPVDNALELAQSLATAFAEQLAHTAQTLDLQAPPTLSVGLAFTHVLQPTGQARGLARKALRLAKLGLHGRGLRNALALLIAPRGGAEVAVVGPWQEASPALQPLHKRLALWMQAYEQEQLSKGSGYDLARLASAVPHQALGAEVMRLLGRRLHGETAALLPAMVGLASQSAPGAVNALAQELYAARWLLDHRVQPPAAAADEKPGTVTPAQVE